VPLVFFFFCFNLALAQEQTTAPAVGGANPISSTDNVLGYTQNDWSSSTGSFTSCNSSGCWGGTSGGYSPTFNGGTIRWGYVGTTVEQNVEISKIIEANTGIALKGYSYSWVLKNADANQESTNGARGQDPLVVTVSVYDNNNQIVEQRTFDYSYHIDTWTYFSGTEWFKDSYLADDLNSVQLQVYGQDAGFWAGWYGPEFDSYNIRLLYSVDACFSDPLSDTDCPGYAEAYLNMMCTADALYDSTCPGYAEAYAIQNVTSNESSSSIDDGSTSDTGGVANDGSVNETQIANSGITENTFEEPVVETVDTSPMSTGVVEDASTGTISQVELQPEPVMSEPEPVVIAEVTESSDPQQEALEEANSIDLESMSASEVVNALQSLGILGNEMTNGVGDPTGVAQETNAVDMTTSSSPLPDAVSNSISQSSSAMTGSDDGSTDNDDGSFSSTSSSLQITQTGMTGGSSMGQPNSDEMSSSSSENFSSSSQSFGASSLSNSGMPDSMNTSDLGLQPDGSYSMLAEIDGAVYQVTLDAPVQSQNPIATGGDPTKDLNSVFGGPEFIADNTNVMQSNEEQNERYESFAKRMVRERIMNINQTIQEMNKSENAAEDDEKFVQEVTEESYAETDALSTSDVSQADFVESMNTTAMDGYTEQEIVEVTFYIDREIYNDVKIPNNNRGLRNGLAQQLLHEQMVQQQYEREE